MNKNSVDNNGNIDDNILNIRKWIIEHKCIKFQTNDEYIVTFLKLSDHNVEKAKELIERVYSARKNLPELFLNRNPLSEPLQSVFKNGAVVCLNKTFDDNTPIYFFDRLGVTDTKTTSIWERYKANFMIFDILMKESKLSSKGVMLLVDTKQLTISNSMQYTPTFLIKCFSSIQHILPVPILGMHLINASFGFSFLISLSKSIMGSLKDVLFIYQNDYNKIYKHFPKELIPIDYGGTGEPFMKIAAEWKKNIESNKAWFRDGDNLYLPEEKI